MDVLTIKDIYYSRKGVMVKALVKAAKTGIGIKEQDTNEINSIRAEEIQEIAEHHGVISHALRITRKDGETYVLDGLTPDVLETVKQYSRQHYKINVYARNLAVNGDTQGNIAVTSTSLEMKADEKTQFEIPLSAVSNAYERRGEGIIDIEESYYGVTELRFGAPKEGSNVQTIVKQVKEGTAAHGEQELLAVEEVLCVLPRGKSKLSVTASSLSLIGKTYSHQIRFSSIVRMFALERSAEEGTEDLTYLILELSTPIRQGQTRYYFVTVLLAEYPVRLVLGKDSSIEYFDSGEEPENAAKEEEEKEKSKEEQEEAEILAGLGLERTYEGEFSACLVTILEKLAKVTAIRTSAFTTLTGAKALRCSSKANEGYLYPLKYGLLFIPKIQYIKYSDIEVLEFSRVNISTRTAKTFDIRVVMQDQKEHMFNSIQKEEFSALEGYLNTKNIKCRSEVVQETWAGGEDRALDEEEEDETTASDNTSTEEE